MKVWVVDHVDWEAFEIVGVFSTKQKAEAWIASTYPLAKYIPESSVYKDDDGWLLNIWEWEVK